MCNLRKVIPNIRRKVERTVETVLVYPALVVASVGVLSAFMFVGIVDPNRFHEMVDPSGDK